VKETATPSTQDQLQDVGQNLTGKHIVSMSNAKDE